MGIGEKMKGLLEQSAQTSKELASKAGAKAQNLKEQAVLALEIKNLKGQVEKLIENLGKEVYQVFAKQGTEIISAGDPEIKKILDEIAVIKENIEKKEAELQEKKEK